VPFATVRALVDKHCVACHAARPVHANIPKPPAGLDFTQDAVLKANARRMRFQAVTTRAMPLGNETHMTMEERRTLGAWVAQGAKLDAK
jgi:uncharacterized membrane protein